MSHKPEDMLPAPSCYAPSEQTKDAMSRWLPTLVAIAGIIGQGFFLGQRIGAAEQELKNTTAMASASVTRVEYLAEKAATGSQLGDVKQTLRDMNQKLDRLVERQASRTP